MYFVLAYFYSLATLFILYALVYIFDSDTNLIQEQSVRADHASFDRMLVVLFAGILIWLLAATIRTFHIRSAKAPLYGLVSILFMYIILPYSNTTSIPYTTFDLVTSFIIDMLSIATIYLLFKEVIRTHTSSKP